MTTTNIDAGRAANDDGDAGGAQAANNNHDDDEVVQLRHRFYILATSSRADDRTRVLKQGDTFGVFDRFGDVQPVGSGEQGLYDEGTRFLSRLELRLGGRRPLLLSSTVKQDNDLLTVDLTNPDLTRAGSIALPRGQVHVFRSKLIWRGTAYERFRVSNYGMTTAETDLLLLFDADYADIFEVRGMKRLRRGRRIDPAVIAPATVVLGYEGLDGEVRRTRIAFAPDPAYVASSGARWDLVLPPHQSVTLVVTYACEHVPAPTSVTVVGTPTPALAAPTYDEAAHALADNIQRGAIACKVTTANRQFDHWLGQSAADLHMLATETPQGPFPFAGVPWFAAPFGRDAIVTALELLWLEPAIARAVLRRLAATQATADIPEQDAQPGKILHEARGGEMAALAEIPFGRYYGSVDATPLYVMLAGAHYDRTGDRTLAEELWPNIERALRWLDEGGDPDGDGFIEYARRSSTGLIQQGWKDSHDSVFHADGTLAEAPIALAEVQAYAYAARRAGARLARVIGRPAAEAQALEAKARRLRDRFEAAFWCEDLGTYALALDGDKRPCRVRTSNAGHALLAGIATRTRARAVATTLLGEASFSGWGVRTLAEGELRYNPMSYHNGSVWPHDNALIAAGLARYGMPELALRVFDGLYHASTVVDLHRMPELVCGFPRRPAEGPTLYPVACAPQAWAAGAVFLLLASSLGIAIDAPRRELRLVQPRLPEWLGRVRVAGLAIADAEVDLLFERYPHDVGLTVLRREGDVRVQIIK